MKQLTKQSLKETVENLEKKCLECYMKHKDSLEWLKENCRTCYIRLNLEDIKTEQEVKTPVRKYGE